MEETFEEWLSKCSSMDTVDRQALAELQASFFGCHTARIRTSLETGIFGCAVRDVGQG